MWSVPHGSVSNSATGDSLSSFTDDPPLHWASDDEENSAVLTEESSETQSERVLNNMLKRCTKSRSKKRTTIAEPLDRKRPAVQPIEDVRGVTFTR